ncbi:MAG: hypothetical protein JO170_14355 [Verrucomicrobia bacterium]|nr:hypothetical protein [Verrucomicrobiota bacterium]
MDESTNSTTNAAGELITSAAHLPEHVADPCGRAKAIETLRRGPHGAVAVASIAVLCVLIIWYAFYFFAYMPRT